MFLYLPVLHWLVDYNWCCCKFTFRKECISYLWCGINYRCLHVCQISYLFKYASVYSTTIL